MVLLSIITVGLTICLGILGLLFYYFIRVGVNPEDVYNIDPVPEDTFSDEHSDEHKE